MTSFGTTGQVDEGVAAILTSYDDMGRVETVTSYQDAAATNVANEVEYACDGWGNETQEWQALTGSVDTNTTPSVQYTTSPAIAPVPRT